MRCLLLSLFLASFAIGARAQDRSALQKRINAAIDRGVDYVLAQQWLDGSWEYHQDRYPTGQTALSVYTLLKMGVAPEHHAIRRGLAYCKKFPPTRTYSVGCLLLALLATHDERHHDWMKDLLATLCEWQDRTSGLWAYPEGHTDLSNTQYAALGLLAAHRAGIDVPRTVVQRLLDGILAAQLEPQMVTARQPARPGGTNDRVIIAGFPYRTETRTGDGTGSMTTAGLGVLAICAEIAGGFDRFGMTRARQADDVRTRSLAWMSHHFHVNHNPFRGSAWYYYYLYGMERVGSILGIDTIGAHDWYWRGAEELVNRQDKSGVWKQGPRESGSLLVTHTCFALLFLKRASAPSTGAVVTPRDVKSYVSDAKQAGLELRATGDTPLTMWIAAIDPDVLLRLQRVDPRRSSKPYLPIMATDYLVRRPGSPWEVVASARPLPTEPASDPRFAARHSFAAGGVFEVRARMMVATGLDDEGHPTGTEMLQSKPIRVTIDHAISDDVLAYADDSERNLAFHAGPRASASSEAGNGWRAALAFDNTHIGRWLCKPNDARPTLVVEFESRVYANTLLLSHPHTMPSERGRDSHATKVEIFVNRDRDPLVVDVDPNPARKTVIELTKRRAISRLAIAIVGVDKGQLGKVYTGFSEVELQQRRARR